MDEMQDSVRFSDVRSKAESDAKMEFDVVLDNFEFRAADDVKYHRVDPDAEVAELEYILSHEFDRPLEFSRADSAIYFPSPFRDRFCPRRPIQLVPRANRVIGQFSFEDSHIEYHRFLAFAHINEVKSIVCPQLPTRCVHILSFDDGELSDDVSIEDLLDRHDEARNLLRIPFKVHVRLEDDYEVVDPTGTCYTIPLPKGTTDIEHLRAKLPPDIEPGYELTLLGNPLTSLRYTKHAKIEIRYPKKPEQETSQQPSTAQQQSGSPDPGPRRLQFLYGDRPKLSLRFDAEAIVADAQSVLSDLFQLAFPPLALWHIGQHGPDQLLATITDDALVEIRQKQFGPKVVRFVLPDATEVDYECEPTETTEGLRDRVSQSLPHVGDLICHGKMVSAGAELQTFYSVSDVIYVTESKAGWSSPLEIETCESAQRQPAEQPIRFSIRHRGEIIECPRSKCRTVGDAKNHLMAEGLASPNREFAVFDRENCCMSDKEQFPEDSTRDVFGVVEFNPGVELTPHERNTIEMERASVLEQCDLTRPPYHGLQEDLENLWRQCERQQRIFRDSLTRLYTMPRPSPG
jgi:hypothetical protein